MQPHNRISKRTGGIMKLADKEWDAIAQCIRKWEGDNRKPFGDIRDAINAVLAKRNVAQPVADAQAREKVLVEALRGVIDTGNYDHWKNARAILAHIDAEKELNDDNL